MIFPTDWLGWLGLVAWLVGMILLLFRFRPEQKPAKSNNRVTFFLLLLSVPLTSMFLGVHLPSGQTLPIPGVAKEPEVLAMMILSAIPWILGAGILGPVQGIALASLSGVFLALWNTHSPYTIFEMAFLAFGFSFLVSQRYQEVGFKALRQPLIATTALGLFYPVLFSVNSFFYTQGTITGQFDYAVTNAAMATLVMGMPLIFAGLVAELFKYAKPEAWDRQPKWDLISTPTSSLETRFLKKIVPLALIMLPLLILGDWIIAGREARKILEDRMASAAGIAAQSVPYFFDTGESLILNIAENLEPGSQSPSEILEILQREILVIPFFNQLSVLDAHGEFIVGYPLNDFDSIPTNRDEEDGIDLALSGFQIQTYSIPTTGSDTGVQISFVGAIEDDPGIVEGVIIGRADFQTNPFTEPILASLASLDDLGGTGFLLDENNEIVYHPDTDRISQTYPPLPPEESPFYDGTGPDGTRQIIYYQPVVGRSWAVVLTLPAQGFQRLALNIAAPLLGMVVLLFLFTIVLVRTGLRSITTSLKSLAQETDRIAHGQLDHPLHSNESDEVGQLHRSFEQMRLSLKARLEELNRLLKVSQGVASSLEMDKAVQPILESALAMGASSARIILMPAVLSVTSKNSEQPSRFGLGETTLAYGNLDHQLLSIMAHQERIVLTNPSRSTLLNFEKGTRIPESLLSVALHHEKQYFGTLWVAYDTSHVFSQEEVRFITTLGGQAALAAANHRLFWSAEFGRQQLAAILASTPDPVIVTDHRDHVLLLNPVAWQSLGIVGGKQVGVPIEKVLSQQALVKLIKSSSDEDESIELTLPDGRFYSATVSSIIADKKRIGRVCVLRDVTHFKELDALKSEFVATVSHDLRSPLTLLRGYATMLDMVGELNEQQENYVKKIVVGVESMSRLINNLLDLGRIEADIKLKLEKLPVQNAIEEVVETLRLQASQKRIQINVGIQKDLPPVIEADHAMLHQAFHNLLENAIKYTPGGKEIWVRVRTRGENLLVEFEDTGIGISPVDEPRLFEKFFRSANREAKKERGTGLGLAIVKSIADRHGGKVWVKTQLGKGSTFYFEVPLWQSHPE